MSKRGYRPYLEFTCPRCKAGPGVNCFGTIGEFMTFGHEERIALAKPRVKEPLTRRHERVEGACSRCLTGQHHLCSGRRRGNHGMPGLPCRCSCRLERKLDLCPANG